MTTNNRSTRDGNYLQLSIFSARGNPIPYNLSLAIANVRPEVTKLMRDLRKFELQSLFHFLKVQFFKGRFSYEMIISGA